MSVALLCINLDRAAERWRTVQAAVRAAGLTEPDFRLHRLAATDGRAMTDAELRARTTPAVRYNLRNRLSVCSPLVLNSTGAVGCYDSHCRAWEWVVEHADRYATVVSGGVRPTECTATGTPPPAILEDDACFDAELGGVVRRLSESAAADRWDALVLGYSNFNPFRRAVVERIGDFGVHRPDLLHFGTHCYAVTPAGARRLLAAARPYELAVDVFLAVVARVGRVRVFLAPQSLSWQCQGYTEMSIPYYDLWDMNVKMYLPEQRLDVTLAVVVATGIVVAMLYRWMRREKKTSVREER